MTVTGTLATARVSALIALLLLSSCGSEPKNQPNPSLDAEMPRKILWAWERAEDLRFLDPKEFGVAFLAQTITLEQDRVELRQRRQPLEIADGTYLIAVTRIETVKDYGKRPNFSDEMISQVVAQIAQTKELRNVRSIQIDFDAVASERPAYRRLMGELAKELGTRDKRQGLNESNATSPSPSPLAPRVSLTMTSLASWCTGDAWFNDFPVDEVVPMVFEMGADSDKIKRYLANGNDWTEPLCRASYGISLEEGHFEGMKDGRRMYYFKSSPWKPGDLKVLSDQLN